MMNITIIALGKLKEKYMRDFCAEYEKRLSAFCKLQIVELNPKALSDKPSQAEIDAALSEEAKMIRAKIPQNAYVFSMCIEGKQMTSPEFSQKITDIGLQGKSNIVFLLGSSFGLDEQLKKESHFKFSMSKMTFPHQLARVLLLEQIYRAFQIASGGKYHK